jgi:hypothetical protein
MVALLTDLSYMSVLAAGRFVSLFDRVEPALVSNGLNAG